jgi:hypothetical protein
MLPFQLLAVLLALTCYLLFRSLQQCRKRARGTLPLPPGPPPRFLVGNLRDLPTPGQEWLKFAAINEKYSKGVPLRTTNNLLTLYCRHRCRIPACIRYPHRLS